MIGQVNYNWENGLRNLLYIVSLPHAFVPYKANQLTSCCGLENLLNFVQQYEQLIVSERVNDEASIYAVNAALTNGHKTVCNRSSVMSFLLFGPRLRLI